MSYLSESAEACLAIVERGARRMQQSIKRQAEMRRAIEASRPVVTPAIVERRWNWTREEKDHVRDMVNKGMLHCEIAQRLGRSTGGVTAIVVSLRAKGVLGPETKRR